MIRGIYSAATGMLTQDVRLEAIANNLANVNTNGYRREITGVQAFANTLNTALATQKSDESTIPHLPKPTILAPFMTNDATAGALVQTGNPTDLALHGDYTFFAVQTPGGVAYTRNGAFTLDTAGRLVTSDGNPIMGERGAITIDNAKWQVMTNGNVVVNGEVVDKLRVVEIPNLSAAQRMGSSLWSTTQVVPVDNARVEQGYLEGSNVNTVTEMVNMISTTRQFEANQRCMQANDSTLERAVNDIARV